MRTVRYPLLLLIAALSGAAGWAGSMLAARFSLPVPALSLTGVVTVLAVVVLVLVLGLRVRRYRDGGRRNGLDPIAAARTLVLAQASAYAGAVLLGWHAGVFLDQLPLWALRPGHVPTWSALAMIASGAVLTAAGLVVQNFCRLPPDDDDPDHPAGNGGPTPDYSDGEGDYA